jgi:hypothetical protein
MIAFPEKWFVYLKGEKIVEAYNVRGVCPSLPGGIGVHEGRCCPLGAQYT